MNPQNNKNLILATSLSVIIMISWTWFYEKPRLEKVALQQKITENKKISENKITDEKISDLATPNIEKNSNEISKNINLEEKNEAIILAKTGKEIIEKTSAERVRIASDSLHGSINLRGARFDDLTLAQYFKNPDKKEEVILFSPAESKERYFADFGFASSNSNIEIPDSNTLWQSDNAKLTPKNPVLLSWKNSQNIEFQIKISLDENYLFTINQKIINNSSESINLAPFGRINRALNNQQKSAYILHEGAIGAFNGILSEKTYEDLVEEKVQKFSDKGESGSWLGITDKYWLSSIIPDKKISFEGSFFHNYKNQNNFYNVDFIGQEVAIASNDELNLEHHLFAGAKKVKILDDYSKKLNLKLFDRAIDFGWFYFLTKPFFFVIEFLYKIFGNFGLAILGMTVIVKLALFPMANKSYSAIAKLKKSNPKLRRFAKNTKMINLRSIAK